MYFDRTDESALTRSEFTDLTNEAKVVLSKLCRGSLSVEKKGSSAILGNAVSPPEPSGHL